MYKFKWFRKVLLLFISIIFQHLTVTATTFSIPDGDVAALITAINTCNTNGQADIINLAANGFYDLQSINFTSGLGTTDMPGTRGLPNIANESTVAIDLIINGNGATIQRNTSAPEFGIISCSGKTIFNNIIFRNAKLNGQGGAIFIRYLGDAEVNNCKFYDNNAYLDVERGGGAIYTVSLSKLVVTNSYFEGNTAYNQGGAISNLLSDLSVISCTFVNNRTTNLTSTVGGMVGNKPCGGAIYVDGARGNVGSIIIQNSTFQGNSSPGFGEGGALFLYPYNSNSVEVTGCTFKNNSAKSAGAYWHSSGRDLDQTAVNNTAYPYNTSSGNNFPLTLHDCVFDGNTSQSSGGALWIQRGKFPTGIYNCTFKNNVCRNPATGTATEGLGGALWLNTTDPVDISSCTFNNNLAYQSGAVFSGNQSTANYTNCTFEGNTSLSYGGAISVPQSDPARAVSFLNCTFANNSVTKPNNPDGSNNGQSGAIHSSTNTPPNTSVTLTNCLFYNQSVSNSYGGIWVHCNCQLVDGGGNIFFPEKSSGIRCVANPVIKDAKLNALANNGGVTQTMSLQAGSPAIDNAVTGAPATDQRGASRTGAPDIGAYEFNGPLPIHLGKFTAIFINNQLRVNWTTLTEINNSHFIVEASHDGQTFKSLGIVKTKALDGNSDKMLDYEFVHTATNLSSYLVSKTETPRSLLVISAIAIFIVCTFSVGQLFKLKISNTRLAFGIIIILFTTLISCSKYLSKEAVNNTGNNKVYIRLVQVDIDGKKEVHKIIQAINQ